MGSLLACLLGRQGRQVTVWEKRIDLPQSSMAIGITPPSLDLLDDLGLGDAFRSRGIFIPRARVYENQEPCGMLDFRVSEQEILSLPQAGTLELLREAFQTYPSVTYRSGTHFPLEVLAGTEEWVIGCDGARSQIREAAGFRVRRKQYGAAFVMADVADDEHLGPDARLYFSSSGAVESFPLPGNQRRWVAQVLPGHLPSIEHLMERVKRASGFDLRDRTPHALWPFEPRRSVVDRYVSGKVILCGDAAHEMSPIGGQGMNTGFADAAHVASVFEHPTPEGWTAYTKVRKRAFAASASRAALGMFLGTRTGDGWSRIRRNVIRHLLDHPRSHDTLSRTFAMRNLPS